MNWSIFKSRTFWTLVVTFVVNGLNAIEPTLTPSIQVVVNAALLVLASYYHINPSQTYNQSQVKK